jgi:hypothetical protein
MADSFTIKTIKTTITQDGTAKTYEGFATEVNITKPGLPEKNSAKVKIWGLKLEDMAQLTMLAFRPLESQHNLLEVEAGDEGGGLALIFKGEITAASADFNSSPDVAMNFEADSGTYPQKIAKPVETVAGEVKASDLFSKFAADAGYEYKNEGLTASVKNAWFPGSPIEKARKLARDIGCELIIDDGSIITLPAGKARQGQAVLLSKETGLVGYPTFNQQGITCRCLFNPDLVYGGLIKVESIVPKASGQWKITKLTHDLSAYKPGGGNWESKIEAAYDE